MKHASDPLTLDDFRYPPDAYWLFVCDGVDAAMAFMQAQGDSTFETLQIVEAVLKQFPILGLPEFPQAMREMPALQDDPHFAEWCENAADRLRHLHRLLKNDMADWHVDVLLACARVLIEEQHGDRRANLHRGTTLLQELRPQLQSADRRMLMCVFQEGIARTELARAGVDPTSNLDESLSLFHATVAASDDFDVFLAGAWFGIGDAHHALAELGIEPDSNLVQAVRAYQRAQPATERAGLDPLNCLSREAAARLELARRGVDSVENLRQANELSSRSRGGLQESHPSYGAQLLNEGASLSSLANQGIEPIENLNAAIGLFRRARELLPASNRHFAGSYINESTALVRLAALGVNPHAHLEGAIHTAREGFEAFGGSGWDAGRCLMNESMARVQLARLSTNSAELLNRAIIDFSRALAMLGPNDTSYAQCLGNLAGAHVALAHCGIDARQNLEQARELFARARAIFVPKSTDCIMTMANQAAVHTELADLGVNPRTNLHAAIDLYGDARACFSTRGPGYAQCLAGEAKAHLGLADLPESPRDHLEQAIGCMRSAQEIFLPSTPDFAHSLLGEANALSGLARLGVAPQANTEIAIDRYERVRAVVDPQSPTYAHALANEAQARRYLAHLGVDPQHHLEKAINLFHEAGARREPDSPTAAHGLIGEGAARADLSDMGIDATANAELALGLFRDAGRSLASQGFYLDALIPFEHRARLAGKLERWDDAFIASKSAIEALESVRATMPLTHDRSQWMEQNSRLYRLMVEAALRTDHDDIALEYVELGRSRTITDLLSLQSLTSEPAHAQLLETYAKHRHRLEEVESQLGGYMPDAVIQDIVGGSFEERHAVLRQRKSELLNDLRNLERELQQVAIRSPDQVGSLSLHDMRALAKEAQRTLITLWAGAAEGSAWIIWPDGDWERLPLPGLTERTLWGWMLGSRDDEGISGWVGAYLRQHEQPQAWLQHIQTVLDDLHRVVMEPICDRLRARGQSAATLVVGGHLGLLPLHAASWDGDTGRRYVLDDIAIAYAPSMATLGHCVHDRQLNEPRLLGVGNPTATGLRPLPFAGWEMGRIKAVAEKRLGIGGAELLVGSAATAQRVAELLPSYPLVHFACHARWMPLEPLDSALILAGESSLTLGNLLRGGAGLKGTRLVVLSACESGAGQQINRFEEEYLGLPAGFIVAGARTVIGSLWPVPEAPTALLMTHMYERLMRGIGAAQALSESQRWLRDLPVEDVDTLLGSTWRGETGGDETESQPFAHPYFWAAFSVFGWPGPVL